MSSPSPPLTAHLKATYTSPSTPNPQILSSTSLALPSAPQSVESKTAYLSTLRAATTALQDLINKDLTARMEQDARDAASGNKPGSGAKGAPTQGGGAAVINEADEEENYGEEVPEDDEV
ncbi:hypothetical protein GQX73_g7557 [Xylaria multiplex]|uniref:EKC/KEOPS complex subunit GON7 n=1 Tax=Xylaria multiplex TaxID=323545 RepID=A0A7C8MQ59_9PEZI|nr:hypothetical protein GQX73_g7557 [Xylaria multiplex]